jgi:ribonuclease D
VGYEAIVRKLAKAHIDKSSRFTDWSRRPLSDKQLAYALSDVTHLRTVYRALKQELDKNGREPWLEQEMAILTSPATYRTEPQDAWRRIKVRLRSRKQLATLMKIAEWREREARERNVPRARVVKDDAIAEIAIQMPQTREALASLRSLPRGYGNSRHGEAILASVQAAAAIPPDQLPSFEAGDEDMSESDQAAAEILKLALKIVSQQQGIASKLIASASDIEKVAVNSDANVPMLHGWRREVFGKLALDLKAGNAVIGFRNGRTTIIADPRPTRQAAAE